MSNEAAAFLAFLLVALTAGNTFLFIAQRRTLRITGALIQSIGGIRELLDLHGRNFEMVANEIPMLNKPERAAEIYRQNDALREVVRKSVANGREPLCTQCHDNPSRPEPFHDGLCDECAGLLEFSIGHDAWARGMTHTDRLAALEVLERITGSKLRRDHASDEIFTGWTADEIEIVGHRAIAMAEALVEIEEAAQLPDGDEL